jgi:hypothetical protein
MNDVIKRIADMIGVGGPLAPDSEAGKLLNDCANEIARLNKNSVKLLNCNFVEIDGANGRIHYNLDDETVQIYLDGYTILPSKYLFPADINGLIAGTHAVAEKPDYLNQALAADDVVRPAPADIYKLRPFIEHQKEHFIKQITVPLTGRVVALFGAASVINWLISHHAPNTDGVREIMIEVRDNALDAARSTEPAPTQGHIGDPNKIITSAPPAPEVAGLVAWLREEAPWAAQHLHKRIGPDEHQFDAAKALVEKTCEAAAALTAQAAIITELRRQLELQKSIVEWYARHLDIANRHAARAEELRARAEAAERERDEARAAAVESSGIAGEACIRAAGAEARVKGLERELEVAADTLFDLGAHDAWASARAALKGVRT